MKKRRSFLKFYLIITILIASLIFIDSMFNILNIQKDNFSSLIFLFSYFFFFFNILSLFIFILQNLERITYFLPIYQMIIFIFFSISGSYLIIKGLLSPNVVYTLALMSLITSTFEIVFSIYLIKKFSLYKHTE